MDESRATSTCGRFFWRFKIIQLLRNVEENSALKLFTIQFFLAIPLKFQLPRFNYFQPEMSPALLPFSLPSYFMEKLRLVESRISLLRQAIVSRTATHQCFDQIKVLASERPLTFGAVCIAATLAALPVFFIFVMGASAVVFTFLGFILVEGTLLTIGTMFVGGLLFVAACIAFPVAAFLGIAYLSLSFTVQVYTSICEAVRQIFLPKDTTDGDIFHRVRYLSEGPTSPTMPMVPTCITDSDLILSRRLASNGQSRHVKYEYYPVGVPFRCIGNTDDSTYMAEMDTAQSG